MSSSPHSDRASKVYLKEELKQDTQQFKNEVDMLQVELLAVEKKKGLLEKEVGVHLLLLFVFSLDQFLIHFDFLLMKGSYVK